ncbi:MAG: hypothetical protein WCQ41_03220, partial [Bacillota bacterium]
MLKRSISILLILAMILSLLFSMPMIQSSASATPVYLPDGTTVVCAGEPAGLMAEIKDLGDGFI